MWGLLIGRAFYIQVLPNSKLSELRERQFETVIKLDPRRGDIVDRNGKELAATVASYSLFADPQILKGPRSVARKLSKILRVPASHILPKLQGERRFVWIERQLSRESRDKIENLKITGLGFVEEGKRVYPHESLLAQTLGFVGQEGQGLEGLEKKFEKELRGESLRMAVPRDARGRPLLANGQLFSERPGGATLHLTIDQEIQYFLEHQLAQATEDHEADRAMGVVIDPQTGEVLALASTPAFDANNAIKVNPEFRRNPIFTDAYEPGSTLKTFTIAAALREGFAQPNTRIYCEKGRMQVDDRWIRESDPKHKWEWLTVNQILEVSSNIGVTKIAFDLGAEKLRAAFLDFGFGDKTGIDVPGETKGILPALPWRKHHFSNISFGHGVSVSPMQIASAYAMIANGGLLLKPRLVRGFTDSLSKTFTEIPRESGKRVLDEQHAAQLRMMLTGATSSLGTGMRARVPGFVVAGKTGTAQKVDPNGRGYLKGLYISSFAGFVPAHDPKFVIYIAVDSPRKGYYGSEVAAPVFNRVAEYALRKSGIAPTVLADHDVIKSPTQSVTSKIIEDFKKERFETVPDLTGLSLRQLLDRLNGQEIKVEIKGKGSVATTLPSPGEPLTSERKLKIFLSE